jgi:glutathione S-transferase
LIGLEMSPYSVKLRSYLRYKQIPFEWMDRGLHNNALFKKHAKVQLIPLLLMPNGEALQDSTPIIERLEEEHPDPSIHPPEIASRFLSALLEEFGDEWCNKLMFQYRWGPKVDCRSAATRITDLMCARYPFRLLRPVMRPLLIRRMVPRMAFAGANETNRPHLERSWRRTVELLEAHLAARPYLFGGRPAFGDFGIFGNLYQAYTDPTCGQHVRETAPAVQAWLERMLEPTATGEFEALESLRPTLDPLLADQVAGRFLPWSVANKKALDAGNPQTRLDFADDDAPYEQKTFKYHAWSLDQLTKKLAPLRGDPALASVLDDTGCSQYLA